MNISRRAFLSGGAATLLSLDGLPVFAAPKGWKHGKKPNLVFGILSDTHLQSGWDGKTPHGGFPLTYVTNAMKLFRKRNIDAFAHLGDMAHRGKNVEAQYHRDIFDMFFPKGRRLKDGRKVEKLLVVGNHELYGDAAGGPGAWAPHIWPDPEERRKHVLCGDLPKHWERIWGEKYEDVWHKEVNGYHFFGRHWTTDEMKLAEFINSKAEGLSLKGDKPFFILSHARNHFACNHALRAFPNAIAFFGHWHMSNADWKTIFLNNFGMSFFPSIQVGACRMDGANCLDGKERSTEGDLIVEKVVQKTAWSEVAHPSRQAMIVNVYDDMVVFERHEVSNGGKLGPDWVLPIGEEERRVKGKKKRVKGEDGESRRVHPFSREALMNVIGEPQFRKRAKMMVGRVVLNAPKDRGVMDAKRLVRSVSGIKIVIPFANGNPNSRVYAYDVEIVGDDPNKPICKSVCFSGVNCGIGREPNKGITVLSIPQSELPQGRKLAISVTPLSSLSTKGRPIKAIFKM